MTKYECPCGYVYDPEMGDPDNGVAPGTPWEDVPEDWVCPVCGLGKDAFNEAYLKIELARPRITAASETVEKVAFSHFFETLKGTGKPFL